MLLLLGFLEELAFVTGFELGILKWVGSQQVTDWEKNSTHREYDQRNGGSKMWSMYRALKVIQSDWSMEMEIHEKR